MTLNKNTGMPRNGNIGRLIAKDIINNTTTIQVRLGLRGKIDGKVTVNGLPIANLGSTEEKLNFFNNGGMTCLFGLGAEEDPNKVFNQEVGEGFVLVINSQWQIYFEYQRDNYALYQAMKSLGDFVDLFKTGSVIGSNSAGSVIVDPAIGTKANILLGALTDLLGALP